MSTSPIAFARPACWCLRRSHSPYGTSFPNDLASRTRVGPQPLGMVSGIRKSRESELSMSKAGVVHDQIVPSRRFADRQDEYAPVPRL
jgi:hypothetical protein